MNKLNQPGRSKSIFLIDELPTLRINKIEGLPAVAREHKVATILSVQDIPQLIDEYGKDKTDTILANLSTQYWGKANSFETAKKVADLGGKYDHTFVTTSANTGRNMPWKGIQNWSSSKGQSASETIQERDRIKTSQVLELAPGQFIGFLSESNYKRCNMQYELGNYEKEEIPQVREVTQMMLDENFEKIIDEALSV